VHCERIHVCALVAGYDAMSRLSKPYGLFAEYTHSLPTDPICTCVNKIDDEPDFCILI
jgi:hypothetical protein